MTIEQSPSTSQPVAELADPIIARAGRYYRTTRYIMFLAVFLFGLWSVRDGFVKWPRDNQRLAAMEAAGKKPDGHPHTDTDIRLNRLLGVGLPPMACVLMAWWLYRSRGAYRLSGQTLEAPGHQPISFEQIRQIDKRLWDRKGVAYIDYEAAGGQVRRLTLDDFVYDAEPTRAIFRRIEEHLAGARPQ